MAYNSRFRNSPPFGKIFLTTSLLISNLLASSPVIILGIIIVTIILLLYSSRFRIMRGILILIAFTLVFIFLLSAIFMLVIEGEPLVTISVGRLVIDISKEGFDCGLIVLLRATSGLFILLFFSTSTPVPHLAYAMNKVRIPKEVILLTILVYRYSFVLMGEIRRMYISGTIRLGFAGWKNIIRTSGRMIGGFFVRSIESAERIQYALASRNFVGEFPLCNCPSRLTVSWLIIPSLFIIVNLVLDRILA